MDNFSPFQIVGTILLAGVAIVAVWLFGSRLLRRFPPMMPLPIQSMFSYCTLFTVGIALISTRASALLPFGILLSFVGLAFFLPEQIAARLFGIFLFLLLLSLLYVLQQLRTDETFFQPRKLSVWAAGIFALVWGMGVLFAWLRWRSNQEKGKDDA
jgi:hypothetical protein